MSLKTFNGKDLSYELLLTTRQKTTLRNAFNNNMPTDLKLSKAQISKTIQSGEFLGSLLSKLVGPLIKVAIPLAKNILPPLGIKKKIKIQKNSRIQEFRNSKMQEFKKKYMVPEQQL